MVELSYSDQVADIEAWCVSDLEQLQAAFPSSSAGLWQGADIAPAARQVALKSEGMFCYAELVMRQVEDRCRWSAPEGAAGAQPGASLAATVQASARERQGGANA